MDITEVVEGRGAQRGPMLRDGEDTRTQVHTSGGGNLNLTLRPGVNTGSVPEPQRGGWEAQRGCHQRGRGARTLSRTSFYSGEPLTGFEQKGDLILI